MWLLLLLVAPALCDFNLFVELNQTAVIVTPEPCAPSFGPLHATLNILNASAFEYVPFGNFTGEDWIECGNSSVTVAVAVEPTPCSGLTVTPAYFPIARAFEGGFTLFTDPGLYVGAASASFSWASPATYAFSATSAGNLSLDATAISASGASINAIQITAAARDPGTQILLQNVQINGNLISLTGGNGTWTITGLKGDSFAVTGLLNMAGTFTPRRNVVKIAFGTYDGCEDPSTWIGIILAVAIPGGILIIGLIVYWCWPRRRRIIRRPLFD